MARRLREIRDGEIDSQVFCEGERIVAELFESGLKPTAIYSSEKLAKTAAMLSKRGKNPIPHYKLDASVMDFCSDLATPPGIIATAALPKSVSFEGADYQGGFVLVLDDVQLPQNVGALIRSAEAAGVERVLLTGASANPWGPKAVRGSVGSVFRVPVHRMTRLSDIIALLKKNNVKVMAATQNGDKNYFDEDWRGRAALVVGSEGRGFRPEDLKLMDRTVTIPMAGKVESLNAGIAAAVCLFEAARQRNHGS